MRVSEQIVSDPVIINHYPLPIAFEYQQLMDVPPYAWRYKCLQLASVFEFTLRYCAIVALSEYRRIVETAYPRSAEIDALIATRIDNPSLEDCLTFIQRIMGHYEKFREKLLVLELYDFIFRRDKHGELSSVKLIEELMRFADKVRDLDARFERRFIDMFEKHHQKLKELLSALAFFQKYPLLRLIASYPHPQGRGYIWSFKVLMGADMHPKGEKTWPQPRSIDEEYDLGLWNEERAELLFLAPFAVFRWCQPCFEEGRDPPEEFFCYERLLSQQPVKWTYIGLRNEPISSENPKIPFRAHRITLSEYVDIIQELRGEGLQRDGHVYDWHSLVRRTHGLTGDELSWFAKGKYERYGYFHREDIEAHFARFLDSDYIGFLVVGDSGTGKTNLLCQLAEQALERGDAVLLHNCASILEEKPDIRSLLNDLLRLKGDVIDFIARLDKEPTSRRCQLLFLFDAINEAKNPLAVLTGIVDLARDISFVKLKHLRIKVALSCRSESWKLLKPSFKGDRYFYPEDEGIEVRLSRFSEEELPEVYENYRKNYGLQTPFDKLSDRMKSFIVDPFMLRLIADSYRERDLPTDPETRSVFEAYIDSRIGYVGDLSRSREHREEWNLVHAMLDKMLDAKREELNIREDLQEDPKLQQQMLDPLMSPFGRLLDKGVLHAFGPRESGELYPRYVKFSHDRVFEFLLQRRVFRGELQVEDVVQRIGEAQEFPSLWGAVKVALMMHMDELSPGKAFGGADDLLVTLAQQDDPQVRGMMIDTLTMYGVDRPQKVDIYLKDVLLASDTENTGRIAVQVAYQLGLIKSLEMALVHPSAVIRQLATQYTFYYWQVNPDKGTTLVRNLFERVREELNLLKVSNLAEIASNFLLRRARGLELVKGLKPLLDLFVLFMGYAYMAGPEIRAVGQIMHEFFDLIPEILAPAVELFLRRWGVNLTRGAVGASRAHGANTLRVMLDLPFDHPDRQTMLKLVRYFDPFGVPLSDIADELFKIGQSDNAAILYTIAMILYPRSGVDLRAVFDLCRRLFDEGNIYSKYLALRVACLAVYMEDLSGEYLEFIERKVLQLWKGREATLRYPTKESATAPVKLVDYPVGHVGWVVICECRTTTGGSSEFVDKLLALPWEDDPVIRTVRIIEELEGAIVLAGATKRTNIEPILETLRRWCKQQKEKVDERIRNRLIKLLITARSFYPNEVELFLSTVPSWVRLSVYSEFEMIPLSRLLVYNQHVGVTWALQRLAKVREVFIDVFSKAATYGDDWDATMMELGRRITKLEIAKEIAQGMMASGSSENPSSTK